MLASLLSKSEALRNSEKTSEVTTTHTYMLEMTILQITEYPRLNHPSAAASAALVELTTRLDFFKERRSQLMEQLQNLDLNYGGSSSQDFIHRPSSPPWN